MTLRESCGQDPTQPWGRQHCAQFRASEGLSFLSGCSKGQLLHKGMDNMTQLVRERPYHPGPHPTW